jgi:HK97 family phage portal protein
MSFWGVLTAPFRSQKVAHEILPIGVVPGQPVYPKPGFVNNVKLGYSKNEIIYSCITYKANSFARVEIDVVNNNDDVLKNHPLENLMAMPNPHTTEYEMLQQIVTDLDVYGLAYWEIVRSGSGQPVQLWRLRPDYVRPVPTADQFIGWYEYDNNTGRKVQLPVEDIIEFKNFDPANDYRGLAPVTVLSRIGDVDNGGVDYLKSFYESGGMPSGFLSTEQDINDTMAKRLRDQWQEVYGGVKKWINVAVLGRGATYQQMGSKLNEMATEKVDQKTISRICMVLKVNPILIGAAHGLAKSTFNNYSTAQRSFWQEGQLPLMKHIIETFNTQLAIEFSNVTLQWDLTSVPALQEDKDKVWTRAGNALSKGALTVNEYRETIGKPPVRGGDVFLRPLNVVEEQAVITNTKSYDLKSCGCDSHEFKVSTPDDEDDRIRREKETQAAVQKFFKGQEKRILKTVGAKNSAYAQAHKVLKEKLDDLVLEYNYHDEYELKKAAILDDFFTKAAEDLDSEFWAAEAAALGLVMTPELIRSAQVSVANTIEAFEATYDIGIPIDLANKEAVKWARKYSAQLVKGITKTTRNSVSESVAAWVESDLPRSALVDEIAPLFGPTRSRTIARTETTKAFFEGNKQTWKVSGIVNGWRWRTTESACPICGPLEGEVFDINSGVGIPDSSHPNCNCFAEAVIDDSALGVT